MPVSYCSKCKYIGSDLLCYSRRTRRLKNGDIRHDKYFRCRKCVNEKTKQYYKLHRSQWILRNKQYRRKYRDKFLARDILNHAVAAKKIVKPNICEHCTKIASRIEGHHQNYANPLDVNWVCPPCHAILDRKSRLLYA